MGMNLDNKNRAIDTVRAALDEGITLFNTGEFYGNGASEMVLGEALRGVRRDSCFVTVKFGMLPKPEGGHYGIDVNPWHVKARLPGRRDARQHRPAFDCPWGAFPRWQREVAPVHGAQHPPE